MVLTRAQARTQATAQQQETLEAVMVVVDHSDETAVAEVVAERSTVELVPHVQDCLAKLAEYFLTQTQALAEGHAFMQIQLEGQGAAQKSTDAGIKQLANQQLTITGRFHEELMATHAGIREQFLRLETMQANVGEEIERSVADRLFRALREAHSESQSMIAAQQLDAKIGSGFQVLTSHIHQLVEEKIATHQASTIEMTIEMAQQLELTSNTITSDGTSHDAVKSFVLEEIEISKRHFEAQACNTIKELVKKEVEKRMELVQLQLLTAHPQTGRCTEISDIKVEHDTKQTVENGVKLIHDLVREAIRRYACVSDDTGDGSGDVGDEEDEDLSKADRSIQQRMQDTLVKAHASALPSQLSEVKSSLNDDDSASPSWVHHQALPLAYCGELSSNGNADRRAVIADVQKEVAQREEAAAKRYRSMRKLR
ncbi:hypothetical protein GN958_ATG12005 [Phytophthora infestans]|uniref:Uncharacterized protein n=1 Tax=Phytophthora infestans TaxID=4787 RepID=A0A8S9UDW1_PHYIN|nr:hypothetical protein GN958_ATG12005 [Phytophthora infestans]